MARFDSRVIIERTAGEVAARCHDERASFLAGWNAGPFHVG